MDSQEQIQNFSDMVNATEKLVKPWKFALVLTNLFWAVVLFGFIFFAYMTPDTSYQAQDFDGHTQYQSVGTEVVTSGK